MIRDGGKLYDVCWYCLKLIRVNKVLFGSMHVCITPEKREWIHQNIKLQIANYEYQCNRYKL